MNTPGYQPPLPSPYVACPRCHSTNVRLMNFTWWGGVLGPKIFSHVKCQDCGTQYNGKTGRPNTTVIIVYTVVVFVVAAGVVFMLTRH